MTCRAYDDQVWMTRDDLQCIHEPFGDAFYYGPERMSSRFAEDEETRKASGFSNTTYKTVFDRIEREGAEVRLFPILSFLSVRSLVFFLV